jgi:hypothetical protein
VIDVRTPRLELHAIDLAEAGRIVDRRAGPTDVWADDFPFEGDVEAVHMFLQATAARGEQRPFGYYRLTRRGFSLRGTDAERQYYEVALQ